MTSLGVIIFVVLLLGSIMLHELGHLATAKHYGMKATRYFVGFGPTLWSMRRGETEYGVKAIPAGGFVKIVGMTDLEEIDPADEHRAFFRQPARARAVVLAAGSTMHFLLAPVMVYLTITTLGMPTDNASTEVALVVECLPREPGTPCQPGDPASPAKAAGVKPGDRIVEFDGKPVNDWVNDFSASIRSRPAGPVDLVIERDGRYLTLRPNLTRATRVVDGEEVQVTQIGLSPKSEVKRFTPLAAIPETGVFLKDITIGSVKSIAALPGAIPKTIKTIVSGDERGTDGLVSPVGIGQVAGQQAEEGNFAGILLMTAGVNFFLGVANLLPLLPLDGGHLAILGFEESRSWLARKRGRRDPGRVDLAKVLPVAYLVIVLMSTLFLLGLYADVTNPIKF